MTAAVVGSLASSAATNIYSSKRAADEQRRATRAQRSESDQALRLEESEAAKERERSETARTEHLAFEQKRWGEAGESYRRALRLATNPAEARAALGLLALQEGDRDTAAGWLRKASKDGGSLERVQELSAALYPDRLPGPEERPAIEVRFRSSKFLITPPELTPRMASTSTLLMGCLKTIIASASRLAWLNLGRILPLNNFFIQGARSCRVVIR